MRAMVFTRPGTRLTLTDVPTPSPDENQLLLRVHACAVCRTDLHVIDGELPDPLSPLIPGHEIIGIVERVGAAVDHFKVGQRVGVPWLGFTCGICQYCKSGRENLCDQARFTGYTLQGGYAEYCVADARFCFPVPSAYTDIEAAPLMCAGLIGYRALRMTEGAERLGIYGFGAAAHLITQVARFQGRKVYAFTRPGDEDGRRFALELGAAWAGDSTETATEPLDAAIIFAPVGALVPLALRSIVKGGVVVCAGIHMSDIPSFPYRILWGERHIRSVANLTRRDGEEFLDIAPRVPVKATTTPFRLDQANEALLQLRTGKLKGAAVLVMDSRDST